MAKKLYLVRHAKTQQESVDGRDFTRELADRGFRDASLVGSYCLEKGCEIDMMISSPAARAIATAELLADQLSFPVEKIHTNEELYMASVRTFLQVVNQLKEDWDNVMITSHNPVVSFLAEYLSNAEIGDMPTSAIAEINFDGMSWAEVSQNTGTLGLYISPRMIKDGEA
jgi:phosphohistidine phosphatase